MAENKRKRSTMGPEETKARLLDAGLELFAHHGFKAVTTRQLSAHAGVNQAAIPYHFGGKEGLYLAVAERIVTFMDRALAGVPSLQGGDNALASAGRSQLAMMLVMLVRALAGHIATRGDMSAQRAFIFREYAAPGKAFEIIYKGGVERMHKMVTAIVAAALGLDPESDEAVIHAHTVVGQVMGFAAGQAVLCRRLGRDGRQGYGEDVGRKIGAIVASMALRATGLEADYEGESLGEEL